MSESRKLAKRFPTRDFAEAFTKNRPDRESAGQREEIAGAPNFFESGGHPALAFEHLREPAWLFAR